MMACSSAFNFEDTRSINFLVDSDRYPTAQRGSSSSAIRDLQSIAVFDYPGAHLQQSSEGHLLSQAKLGNQQAFAELFQRYSVPLGQTIFRIVRNRQDTEDIVQETMLSACSHLNCFRETCKFYTWITRIGINRSLMLLRKRKVRSEDLYYSISSEASRIEVPEYPDDAPNPEQMYANKQINEALLKSVGVLPIGLRDIFEHHYRENCSLQESADTFGLTVAAAKSRLLRARRALRSSLRKRKISLADFAL